MGNSIGDWACGIEVGSKAQRSLSGFPLRVVLRTGLIFLTGIILLPILSLLSGFDVAGRISGTQLFVKHAPKK